MNESTVNKILESETKLEELKSEIKIETKEITFTIYRKPEPYARPRVTRHGTYNPKATLMDLYNKELRGQLCEENYQYIKNIIKNNITHRIELEVKYYIPISKNETNKNSVLKKIGIYKPTSRPDLDNYDKFILDVLHNVIYEDDKVVTKITSEKLYDFEGRTEIIAKIFEYK